MAHWFVSPKEDVREVECELKCVRGEPQLITSHSTYSSLNVKVNEGDVDSWKLLLFTTVSLL